MNIQTALIPNKHVRFGASLLAIAGLVRFYLTEPKTIDELWGLIKNRKPENFITPSYTQVIFAIDILFAINQLSSKDNGMIYLKNNITNVSLGMHHEAR